MSPIDPHAALVSRVATGDRSAFKQLFLEMGPRVRGFYLKGGISPSVADELLQEVMLAVWRGAARFDPRRARVTTWLFTIARNKRIDRLRRLSRPEMDPDDPVVVPAVPTAPDARAESRRREEVVHRALDELPEDQATILRRAYYEGASLKHISDELGVPLGTVKSRVRLAMGRLRLNEELRETAP